MPQHVLIVDDHPHLQLLFSKAFLRSGYEVDIVENGQQALDKLETTKPDLIILDLNIPIISGMDVLRTIRQSPTLKDIIVVIITGDYSAKQDKDAELADLLLIKPVKLNEMTRLAQQLIESRTNRC